MELNVLASAETWQISMFTTEHKKNTCRYESVRWFWICSLVRWFCSQFWAVAFSVVFFREALISFQEILSKDEEKKLQFSWDCQLENPPQYPEPTSDQIRPISGYFWPTRLVSLNWSQNSLIVFCCYGMSSWMRSVS